MGSSGESTYADRLVELSRNGMVLHHYYFPGWSKKISYGNIERIEIRKATLRTGKWRIWGTGDMRTWFPADLDRPKRDRIFIIYLKDHWRRIGFTAEDPDHLTGALQQTGIPTIEGE
jgi:hypothetical protein